MKIASVFLTAVTSFGMLGAPAVAEDSPTVKVYRSPTCGCCGKWVSHLEENGFRVDVEEIDDVTPVKMANAVPGQLASCHTAIVDGYVVEGHVPASDVERLLRERPAVNGLAVPGMPIGSPGMEGPHPERYDVLTFDSKGKTEVFSTHGP